MDLLIRSTLAYTLNTSWKNFHPPKIFSTIRSDWTLVLLLLHTTYKSYNLTKAITCWFCFFLPVIAWYLLTI